MARGRSSSLVEIESGQFGHRSRSGSKSSCAPCTEPAAADSNPLGWPTGLCYLPQGYLAVADYEKEHVQLYDNSSQLRATFVPGLINPFCVTATYDDHLIVTDQRSKCAAKFSLSGELLMTGGHANFEEPSGISALPDGSWVCTDTRKHTALLYNTEGIFVKEFGGKGTGFVQMDWPAYVTTDSKNRIVVSDCNNFAVKLFDHNGKYLCRLGGNSKHGKILFPKGVCVDDRGNFFVVEWGHDCIKMYGADGRFVTDILTLPTTGMVDPQAITWMGPGSNSLIVSCKSPQPGIGIVSYA